MKNDVIIPRIVEKVKAAEESSAWRQTDFLLGAEWADDTLIPRVREYCNLHMPFGEVSKEQRDEFIEDLIHLMKYGKER